MHKHFLIITLFLCLFYTGRSQNLPDATPEYVKLMKQRANVKTVQQSFEAYYQRQVARNNLNARSNQPYGWKQYKRWEYWWEPRTYPSGEFPETSLAWRELQQVSARTSATAAVSNWTSLGPNVWSNVTGHWAPGIGRINVVMGVPGDANTIYIGTPAGGLWRTTNGGTTWTPLTDGIPSMGVSAIAIHPTNTNTILIGTGDRDAADTYGVGVLKSTDGGLTWNTTSITWAVSARHSCSRMVVHPSNPNVVMVGTTDGLYRSTDFGSTWTRSLTGDIDDVEVHPSDPNIVYALVGKTLYRSTNGGVSFSTTGQTSSNRAQIAVTPAAPDNIYYFSKQGLYVSSDKGVSFVNRGAAPTEGVQDWYDLAIAVSPTDANRIHVGEFDTYTTGNMGTSWTKLTNWLYAQAPAGRYVHCDVHEITYLGNTLYVGSDGLVTRSTDGVNFSDLSAGLTIGQFYRLGISSTDPNKFGGGLQDNGTYLHTPGTGWHGWLGADGFDFVIAPDNTTLYGTSQNGNFYKSTNGGTNSVTVTQPGPGAWNTPFVMHPTDQNTLFVGTNTGVVKTTNGMTSWTTIGTFNPGPINALTVAKSNANYLYASVKERLWVTKNGGTNWTEITTGLPGYYITNITVDPLNAERVVVTCSGYNSGKKVFISTNGGTTWTNISYNLPNLPANTAVFQAGTGLYVGMDVGIYFLPDNATTWDNFNSGLPNVPVTELEIQTTASKLRASTYGRGMWESPLVTPGITYCASKGLSVQDEYINRVQLANLDHTSGSNGGYADRTAYTATATRGNAYTITITPAWTGTVYPEGYAVWIDYNANGVFTDAGELVWSKEASSTTPASGSFTIPATTTAGTKRMRVSMRYNALPSSCETFDYGEVEDYTINIVAPPTCTNATVTLVLDDYPTETTWSLKNAAGTTIASGGPYTDAQKRATITSTNCLADGCYTFTINDAYGDGICCAYGNGSYSVQLAGGTVLASGSTFASTETKSFCIGSGSVTTPAAPARNDISPTEAPTSLDLFPNPATTTLHVRARGTDITSATIISVDGTMRNQVSIQNGTIDISSLAPGLYFLQLTTPKGILARKFIRE